MVIRGEMGQQDYLFFKENKPADIQAFENGFL
jgi:hypothetical protein